MRHLSLFSGVGGVDLGFERAGMKSIGQVEFSKQSRAVLAAHWPNVPRWNDVREVHDARIHSGNSVPASRGGEVRDAHNQQTSGRASGEGRHIESDADHLVDGGRNGGAVCGACLPNRVDVLSGGFPCQDISMAGKRRGLDGDRSGLWFEFARLITECSPRWVLIENVPGLLSSNRGRDLGTILGFLGEHGFRWSFRVLDAQWFGVAQRRRRLFIVASSGAGSPSEVLLESASCSRDPVEVSELGKVVAGATEERSRGSRRPGGGEEDGLICFSAAEGFSIDSSWQREMSTTLTTGGDRQAITQPTLRRLMPVEFERLQGFPDGWCSDISSESHAFKQMGNAVCVNVAEWIGRRMMAAEHNAS